MINFRKYKKMTFIITVFSLIIFTFSIVTSIIISNYKNENQLNNLQNSNTKYFKFDTSNKISFAAILETLNKYNSSDIYLEYDPIPKYMENDTLFGKAIYYNHDLNNKFPILEGRNFSMDDINSNKKEILVGKQLKKEIVQENNERYFIIDNEKYKVIGILGDENKETGYDATFIINLKSMDYFSDNRATWKLNANKLKDTDNIINKLNKLAKDNNIGFQIIEKNNKANLLDIINKYSDFIYILKMIFGFGMLNLIIVVYYWMNKNIKDIGIRKAYGAKDLDIALYILKKYEISVIISLFIGVSLHFIFKTVLKSMFPKLLFDIYIENITFVTIIFMFIGLLVAIIPLVRAKKVQPISIMKGRLK